MSDIKVKTNRAKASGIATIIDKDGNVKAELQITDVEIVEQLEQQDADKRQHDPE